jgi:hypothetical protein
VLPKPIQVVPAQQPPGDSFAAERPVLSRDDPSGAPGTVAYAGVDSTQEGRALQDALLGEIATRGGSCWWDVGCPLGHAGCTWVVTGRPKGHAPERQDFYCRTLEEALAWWLVWLMAPEIGVGPFLA